MPAIPLTVVPVIFLKSDSNLVSAMIDVEQPLSIRYASVVALLAPIDDAAIAMFMYRGILKFLSFCGRFRVRMIITKIASFSMGVCGQ